MKITEQLKFLKVIVATSFLVRVYFLCHLTIKVVDLLGILVLMRLIELLVLLVNIDIHRTSLARNLLPLVVITVTLLAVWLTWLSLVVLARYNLNIFT